MTINIKTTAGLLVNNYYLRSYINLKTGEYVKRDCI